MESDHTIRLGLELGFQDHLKSSSSRLEQKKNPSILDDHQQHTPFSFLSLALSEPKPRSEDEGDDQTTAVREEGGAKIKELNKAKTVVAAASSLTAVSSWTSKTPTMSDENEDCNTLKKKLRLSKDQISTLENTFKLHQTLNPKNKNDLATQLNLRPRQVEVWFQNRRARIKMKQSEVDRESLKKCCEILTEENKRLQKEVIELKEAMPFQIQSPSLPMCPSCDRMGRSSNPNGHGDGSPTRSFFSSSSDSSNTNKTRLCKSTF